jgi:hypothetical protein
MTESVTAQQIAALLSPRVLMIERRLAVHSPRSHATPGDIRLADAQLEDRRRCVHRLDKPCMRPDRARPETRAPSSDQADSPAVSLRALGKRAQIPIAKRSFEG